MALVKAAVQATIKAKLDAEYGIPADPLEQAKFTGALADALIEILTTQMVVTTSSTGATLTGPAGGPLPITALPGTGVVT